MSRLISFLLLSFGSLVVQAGNARKTNFSGLNIDLIVQLTGEKGEMDAKENVFKISAPRNDFKININGVKKAALQ